MSRQQSILTSTTIDGSAWSSVQTVLSRLFAAGTGIVVARFLSPSSFGEAAEAAAVGTSMMVLMPGSLVDVLIARWSRFPRDTKLAGHVAFRIGLSMCLVTAVVAGVWLIRSPTSWVPWLLLIYAARPLFEAFTVVPLSLLRTSLHFKHIAISDTVASLLSSFAGIVFAISTRSPLALAIPPVILIASRALIYKRFARSRVATESDKHLIPSHLLRDWLPATLSQYVHTLVVTVDLLLLAVFGTSVAMGYYSFAISVALQAQSIFVLQLSSTLQPVLSTMNDEVPRQTAAIARTLKFLSAVSVPVAAFQICISESLIRVVFGKEWVPAWPVFALTCVTMAVGAGAGPLTALLKARGWFVKILWWQFGHLVVLSSVLAVIAANAPNIAARLDQAWGLDLLNCETFLPSVIAAVVGLSWIASVPIGLMLALRITNPLHAFRLVGLGTPVVVCLPLAALAFWLSARLALWLPPISADLLTILVVGPLVLLLAMVGTARLDSGVRADLLLLLSKARDQIGKRRNPPRITKAT